MKVTGTLKKVETTPPESFDPLATSWEMTLRYEGREATFPYYTGSRAGEPTIAGVLECLVLDMPEDGARFEDWASDYGYDEDSRKAYATWEAVVKNTDSFRWLMGSEVDYSLPDEEFAEQYAGDWQ